MESSFLTKDQALSLWSGSTDSKTLDYQRTNPRGYQKVRTHRNETTGIQDPASPNHQQYPVQDVSSKQQTKQNTKPIISRLDYHLTEPCPSEEKQTNKQKLSTNLTIYEAYTNHWRAEMKRKKEFNPEAWENETSNTIS